MWTRKTPDQYLASWAYKTICDYLWNWNALPSHNEELVGYVNRMRRNNQDIIPPDIGAAFSAKSITGAYDWLVPLQPPVLHGVLTQGTVKSFKNATFSRRQTCSTALFVMAVAYISREYGDGGKFVLDDMRKRAICRVCLIEESAFDSTLDETIRKAPQNWDSIR